MRDYAAESYWLDSLDEDLVPRPPLEGTRDADIVIVGAGYSGLWTAYYLLEHSPQLRVVICEAGIAGIGASGRNGGWCMGVADGVDTLLSDPGTRQAGLGLARALFATVDEVRRVVEQEEIDCHFSKGGSLAVATLPIQRERTLKQVAEYERWGLSPEDYRWLSKDELEPRLRASGGLGGLYTPHVAAIHPARLVRGLARAVESRGGVIHEASAVREVRRGLVETDRGQIRSDWVVIATEGYTPRIRVRKRKFATIHSMMVVTEPLSQEIWKEIGLSERETFGGMDHMVNYGQRTADGRVAFGSRGAYYYGSAIRERFSADDPLFRQVRQVMTTLLPQLRDVGITHQWGGPMGFPRNLRPGVGADRESRLAFGGGYQGEGVGASNLVGRILADLLLERDTDLVHLPWVGDPSPDWEPEPLRWLAISTYMKLMARADSQERAGRKPGRLFQAFQRFF